MRIDVDALLFDSPDPDALATFYEGLLGYVRTFEDEGEVMIAAPDGSGFPLLFVEGHDEKTTKNRVHLDLRPDDHEAAVAHALSLGATHADVGQHDDPDVTWVVLADPDGNEFCVLSNRVDILDADELVAAEDAVRFGTEEEEEEDDADGEVDDWNDDDAE